MQTTSHSSHTRSKIYDRMLGALGRFASNVQAAWGSCVPPPATTTTVPELWPVVGVSQSQSQSQTSNFFSSFHQISSDRMRFQSKGLANERTTLLRGGTRRGVYYPAELICEFHFLPHAAAHAPVPRHPHWPNTTLQKKAAPSPGFRGTDFPSIVTVQSRIVTGGDFLICARAVHSSLRLVISQAQRLAS